jgi:mercuric ion transport protein
MNNDRLLKIGIIGTVVAALCCFTPILVVLVAAVGLFILITIIALAKRARA